MSFWSTLAGFFTRPAESPVTKPAGSDGVWIPGGFLSSGERHRDLQGRSKWKAYDDAVANDLTVAAMARIWGALLGGSKWIVEPNKRGGAKAERAADLVREGLIEATMATPWNSVVRKAGFGSKFRGFAMFEQILRRRADGKLVTDRLEARPQHTIEQWDKPDEQQPWRGVVQRTASGATYYVQRERLFYVVDDLLSESPDGIGILRHCIGHVGQIERFEQLEGWGFELDLRGVPKVRAPIKDLVNEATTNVYPGAPANDPRVKAWVLAQIKFLDDFAKNHVKNPELSITLDSETYRTGDEKRAPSDVRKWDVELLEADVTGQEAVAGGINRKAREILRLLGMEWLAMGDGEGARAVHTDKTTMAGLILNGTLEDIGAATTLGPARRLVALNGMDPDTTAPRVYAEPVPTETLEAVANVLAAIAKAGAPLKPDDIDIVNAVLERARLPAMKEPDPATMMLPRLGPDGRPIAPTGTPPDPAKGEVDVDLEDDGDEPKKRSRRR